MPPVTLRLDKRHRPEKIWKVVEYMYGVRGLSVLANGLVVVTGDPDAEAVRARLQEKLRRTNVTIVEPPAAPPPTTVAEPLPPFTPASHPAEPEAAQPYPQPRFDQIAPPRPRGGGGLPREGFYYSGDGGGSDEWAPPGAYYAALPQEIVYHPRDGGSGWGQQQSAAAPAATAVQQWGGGQSTAMTSQEWTVPWETGEYQQTPNAPTEIFSDENAKDCTIQ